MLKIGFILERTTLNVLQGTLDNSCNYGYIARSCGRVLHSWIAPSTLEVMYPKSNLFGLTPCFSTLKVGKTDMIRPHIAEIHPFATDMCVEYCNNSRVTSWYYSIRVIF